MARNHKLYHYISFMLVNHATSRFPDHIKNFNNHIFLAEKDLTSINYILDLHVKHIPQGKKKKC